MTGPFLHPYCTCLSLLIISNFKILKKIHSEIIDEPIIDQELVCLHDPFLTSVTDIESIEKFKDRKVQFQMIVIYMLEK